MSDEANQLDLLAIFHYVVGGMTALFACIPLIHVAIGLALLQVDFEGPNPPPAWLGAIFVVVGGLFVLCGWAVAAAILVAGRKLHKRRSRIYCLVVGALECLVMPFGTILGVFTLIVLTKDAAKALFGEAGSAPVAVPPPAPPASA